MSCNQPRKAIKSDRSEDTQYSYCIAYQFFKALPGFISLCLLLVGLAGCTEEPAPYRPPTIAVRPTLPYVATSTSTSVEQTVATLMPTSTPACTDNLAFLENLSLPDGAVVHPGDVLDKHWLVENSGSCNWNESYRLKLLSGADLNAPIEQSLYPARSGTKAIIRIVFTAPDEPGTYQSAWQAYDPQGKPFGDPIYIHIVIDSGQF